MDANEQASLSFLATIQKSAILRVYHAQTAVVTRYRDKAHRPPSEEMPQTKSPMPSLQERRWVPRHYRPTSQGLRRDENTLHDLPEKCQALHDGCPPDIMYGRACTVSIPISRVQCTTEQTKHISTQSRGDAWSLATSCRSNRSTTHRNRTVEKRTAGDEESQMLDRSNGASYTENGECVQTQKIDLFT